MASVDLVDSFKKKVVGICDSLPLLRKKLLTENSHALGPLFVSLLGTEFAAHDAVEDVAALEKILLAAGVTKTAMTKEVHSTE